MGSKGSEIVSRIDTLALKKGLNRPEMCKRMGIALNSFTNWSKRDTVPPADVAIQIADLLGVSVRLLIEGKEEKGYTQDERNLITKYRCLTDQGQYEVNTLIDAKLTVLDAGEGEKKEA